MEEEILAAVFLAAALAAAVLEAAVPEAADLEAAVLGGFLQRVVDPAEDLPVS